MADPEVQFVLETKSGGNRVEVGSEDRTFVFEKRGAIEYIRGGAKVRSRPFPQSTNVYSYFFPPEKSTT